MTYIDLINSFWVKDMEFNFSDREIALYFYLLSVCNRLTWKNPFGQSNAMMAAKFGWSKSSFDTAKKRLKDAGLIDFKAGDGRGNVYQYTIIGIKGSKKGAKKEPLSRTLSDTLSRTLSSPKQVTSIDKDKDLDKEVIPPTPLAGDGLDPLFEQFKEFYQAYRGRKDGLATMYAKYSKKYADWKSIVPLLLPALEKEVRWREQAQEARRTNSDIFIPQWAMLSTWLNQRRWEQELSNDVTHEKNERIYYTAGS